MMGFRGEECHHVGLWRLGTEQSIQVKADGIGSSLVFAAFSWNGFTQQDCYYLSIKGLNSQLITSQSFRGREFPNKYIPFFANTWEILFSFLVVQNSKGMERFSLTSLPFFSVSQTLSCFLLRQLMVAVYFYPWPTLI